MLLERLTPVERAAYLLREVFGYDYAEIADIIERSEVNSRQLVTRARKHLEAGRPRFDADEAARDALLERFLAAAEEGDLEALEELLAKDAVLYADGGGKALAPPEPLVGAAVIARFMAGVAQVRRAAGAFESRLVQGQRPARPGAARPGRAAVRRRRAARGRGGAGAAEGRRRRRAALPDARAATLAGACSRAPAVVWSVLTVDVVDGRIQAVRIVRNPDKLGHL